MSIGICKFCLSNKTKESFAYPTDYFCLDCKQGDLKTNLLKQVSVEEFINTHKKEKQEYIKNLQSKSRVNRKEKEDSDVEVIYITESIIDGLILDRIGKKTICPQ